MVGPAEKSQSLEVELTDADVEWLDERAERLGVDRLAALADFVRTERERETRQARAREEFLAYLGDAAHLDLGESEAIEKEIEGEG